MEQKEKTLREAIAEIRQELMRLGEMRPGNLSRQTAGNKSAQYWQVSYTHKMKSRTEYVRADQVSRIQKEIQTYQRFKKLVQQWVDAALELSQRMSKNAKIKPSE